MRFPQGAHKALTMSYDDGLTDDIRLVDIFNRHGIKGSFFLNSGLTKGRVPLEDIAALYSGHEIACHTLTHPSIALCPLAQVARQVLADRANLERACGYPVRGMSYPNGSYNREITQLLPALGIRYSRIVGNSDSFAMPEDLYRWKATCHHDHDLLALGKRFLGQNNPNHLHLMYVWGHSYEFSRNDNWGLIEDFCAMAGGCDGVWYATNIAIADYADAWKALCFSADMDIAYNPSAQPLWLSADGEIKMIPAGGQISI